MYLSTTCPEFLNLELIRPSTALSRSADSNTMNGALPPNSKLVLFMVEAHCLYKSFPTAVDPT